MSLRRRLVCIYLVYLTIALVGGALALRLIIERNQVIGDQRALVRGANIDTKTRQALLRADDRLDDFRTELSFVVFGALGTAILTTLVGALLVRRWVTRPIDQVASAVRGVRSGEIGVIAPYGPPELANLARDVDSMRVRMNRALYDALRARETIEQSASVVLTLRSQLASELEELPQNWTVAAQLQPAEGVVAGDCYDVIALAPHLLGILVVDISGHGAVSGILALRCKELLRAALRNGLEPGDAVQWAADQLDDLAEETFLSAFVAIVDLTSGRTRYASAGHPPPLLCGSAMAVELPATGPIVGFVEKGWGTAGATVGPGDTLAIYTDGLIEVRNHEGEEYGVERLVDLFCGSTCDEADIIAKRCVDEITLFAPGRLVDDVTVVLLCRGPRETREPVKLPKV